MSRQSQLSVIRSFFLETDGPQQRRAFVSRLPQQSENDLTRSTGAELAGVSLPGSTLLEIEEAFFQLPLGSAQMRALLERNNLEAVYEEISRIQGNFYLKVYSQYEEDGASADHQRLVDDQNESYRFLADEETFELDVEAVFKQQELILIKQRVKGFEQERQKAQTQPETFTGKTGILHSLVKYAPWLAAACVALVIWQPFHAGNEEIYQQFLTSSTNAAVFRQDYPASIAPPASRPNLEEDVRGEEPVDTVFSRLERAQLEEALVLFEDKRYGLVVSIMDSLQISARRGAKYLLPLAIARMHTGNSEQAAEEFKQIVATKATNDEARFYLSLCYIKANNRPQARIYLRELAGRAGPFQQRSEEVLRRLRWF